MCNCFEENLKKIKEHLTPQLPEQRKELEIKWVGYSFFLDGKSHVPVNPKISVEYRGFKKNGDPKVGLTKDTVTVVARYCPFCGEDTKEVES